MINRLLIIILIIIVLFFLNKINITEKMTNIVPYTNEKHGRMEPI